MFANRSKLGMFLILIFISLICLAGGIILIMRSKVIYGCYHDRPPLINFDVTIERSQSEGLINQSQKFAHENGFSYEISYYSPSGDDFSIWMKREDLLVIIRSPFTRGEFKIGFYNNNCINPTLLSDINDLVSDLKLQLSEIPSIIISEPY